MLERIKHTKNPLTIIAIFSGIAEVALTVALRFVNPDLQAVFIWFVMGFPVLLVLSFFLTLNFNHTVLYAPSDFKNEENFLITLRSRKELYVNFREINETLASATDQIVDVALKQIEGAGESERTRLSEVVNRQIELIREKVETTRESAVEATYANPAVRIASGDRRAEEIIAEVRSQGVSSTAQAEQLFVKKYIDRYGLEDYLVDHEIERGIVQRLLKESNRVGEFLDRISRGPNPTIPAMEAVTSLYAVDVPFLTTAYQLAKQRR